MFIISYILAVLLESFSIFYNDEETNLDLAAMKDFKRKWRKFDLNAKVAVFHTLAYSFFIIVAMYNFLAVHKKA